LCGFSEVGFLRTSAPISESVESLDFVGPNLPPCEGKGHCVDKRRLPVFIHREPSLELLIELLSLSKPPVASSAKRVGS
jgi:hypothetical protein